MGLATIIVEKIFETIKELNQEGITILLVELMVIKHCKLHIENMLFKQEKINFKEMGMI